ncbi:hypothetical protein ACOSQ4_003951 [Xanthoceras sorbifolium]
MEMHIAEREKLSYIRGKKAPPAKSEDGYQKWYAENQKRYLRLPTTQEIWNALSKAFYDGSDELRVFSLNQKAFAARQTYKKSIERLRVHIFLAGLDGAFEQVQGDILYTNPIPDLEECYALVSRETVRQTTLKGECDTSDISAMVAQRLKTSNSNANPVDKSSLKCTHYLGGMNLESTGSALSDTEEMIEEGRDSMIQSSSLSEQHGSEEALADIPNQSSSIEDILNLEYESSRKQLPYRHTRGIPKPIYEPELSSRVRYPMSNYVSSKILSWD